MAGKTVGIAGGGPGGMLCAAQLARLGAAVEVFERHDPEAADTGRPPPAVWSIALGTVARRAIEAAGLNPDFGPQWKCVSSERRVVPALSTAFSVHASARSMAPCFGTHAMAVVHAVGDQWTGDRSAGACAHACRVWSFVRLYVNHVLQLMCLNAGPCCRLEGSSVRSVEQPPRFFGKWTGATAAVTSNFYTIATQPGIVEHLRAECERVYPESVTVSHGMRAVGGNVADGELVLEDSAGERHERQFDMVVGADGVGSTVRKLMQEQVCCRLTRLLLRCSSEAQRLHARLLFKAWKSVPALPSTAARLLT